MSPAQKPDPHSSAHTTIDVTDVFEILASQAVRRRIRARWERRRAETDGGTAALSRWSVNGRYTYARPGWAILNEDEVDRMRGGREYLVYVQAIPAHPLSLRAREP